MKVNTIYKLLACFLIFSSSTIIAQTGVMTHNPQGAFHIDGADDNAATVTPAQAANDVVVTAAGNMGVGVLNPVTKVDLRSADQKGIIGIGANTQTAVAAGAGAIRYIAGDNPDTVVEEDGYLEYSDGEKWIPLPLAEPAKALVNANKSIAQNIGNNSETFITNWVTTVDSGGDFDVVSGTFTAPRDGFYLVTFNITFASASIARNSFIETIIESSQTTDNIPVFKTINSFPAYQATLVSNFVSGNCNGIFNLEEGDEIRFKVRHTLGGTRATLNNGTFNNISISEL